jgi:deazaflavin-dependent oxidoreductase (nitroreductase family)
MAHIGNAVMSAIIKSPFFWILGSNFAVIKMTGRKSGKEISTPINVTHDKGEYWVVSMPERTWWRNLRDHAKATLHVRGRKYTVTGEVFENMEQAKGAFEKYFRKNPKFARFYSVQMLPDGQPNPSDIERVARRHIVIRLTADS